jgi:hypothetical protein
VRTEYHRRGKLFAIAISDPTTGRLVVLDPRRRTGQEVALGECTTSANPFSSPPDAEWRVVEGFKCFRVSTPDGGLTAWVSPGLHHLVQEQSIKKDGVTTWRLFAVERGEPEAALFQVPPDFRVRK